ncbi:Chromosome segregation ATPase [uncultured Gammaproteobacteria bacterium]|nr:Chromosome segregation ATPase [uncultured Gammaproteobacteria bacterium]
MKFPLKTLLTILVIAIFILAIFLIKSHAKLKKIEDKYSAIINVNTEVKKQKIDLDLEIAELRKSYKEKREIFDKLVQEAAIYDEEIQLAELGFYKPHFDFDTSEKYKEEISIIKNKQKEMVSLKEAIYCTTEWTVEGSKAKGKTMTNRGIKLTARAFNNECDAAISNTRWNNVDRMVQRLEKAFDAIDRMNQSNAIFISSGYFNLKLKELRLAYEYADKKQQEKEEQQEIKRQMREEAKLQ